MVEAASADGDCALSRSARTAAGSSDAESTRTVRRRRPGRPDVGVRVSPWTVRSRNDGGVSMLNPRRQPGGV
jgi:hypothetical protein